MTKLQLPNPNTLNVKLPGVGGGGGGNSPQMLVGMCRGKVKNGPGLRNELEPFWAFGLSRPWEAMNAGLKFKKFWNWWSPERQNPPKNVKWWCSGTDFLVIILWKWYAPERKFRAENGGLSRGIFPISIHIEVPPPPHGSRHYFSHCSSGPPVHFTHQTLTISSFGYLLWRNKRHCYPFYYSKKKKSARGFELTPWEQAV